MGRWDFRDPDRVHSAEPRTPGKKHETQPENPSPAVGRSGGNEPTEELQSRERLSEPRTPRSKDRRTKHNDHGREYSLRASEIEAMADIGRFRAVDVRDLARFVYKGDDARMKYDLASLRAQGLIEEKTVFRTHKPARKVVTLTRDGHRMIEKAGGLPPEQKLYHGFVKPKELDHDTGLYKVYQKAAERIEGMGGKALRIRLDFELKESINRAKTAAGSFPDDMRERWLGAVAREHGLTTDGKTIHLPDIQIEYTTQDGRIARENLELVSRNYREQGIRGKAAAGFSIYARAADTSRIRRALQDTGLARQVLSI
jgi:DNA-binding PadR family transcriptional regulator